MYMVDDVGVIAKSNVLILSVIYYSSVLKYIKTLNIGLTLGIIIYL